jgi:hypothetical protein
MHFSGLIKQSLSQGGEDCKWWQLDCRISLSHGIVAILIPESQPRLSLNSTVLMFALSVCLNTLSSRKYKSFAVLQEFAWTLWWLKLVSFITNKSAEVLLASLDSHSIFSKVVSHSSHRLSLKPNLCWCCFVLCVLIASHWKTEYCFLRTKLACKCIGCGFVGGNYNHCQWILEC